MAIITGYWAVRNERDQYILEIMTVFFMVIFNGNKQCLKREHIKAQILTHIKLNWPHISKVHRYL